MGVNSKRGKNKGAPSRSHPAYRKVMDKIPKALDEHWTVGKLSKEAGVSYQLAQAVMREHVTSYSTALKKMTDSRVTVARQTQQGALSRIPVLQSLLDTSIECLKNSLPQGNGEPGNPVALDEFGEPKPLDPERIMKAMHGAIRASNDLYGYMERVTGMDVVKAVSIRSQTQAAGPVQSWEGMAALETAIEAEVIPDYQRLSETTSQEGESEEDWV